MKETKVLRKPGSQKMVQSKFEFEERPSAVRQSRIGKQLSQDDMAEKLDRSLTTYGEIERGRRPVHVETANRVSEILGKKVEDLFVSVKKGKKLVAKRLVA